MELKPKTLALRANALPSELTRQHNFHAIDVVAQKLGALSYVFKT